MTTGNAPTSKKTVDLLVVPYDMGLREWRMGAGPGKLLDQGLVEHLSATGYSAQVSMLDADCPPTNGQIAISFSLMRLLAERVRASIAADRFPLILTGNCNLATGILAGLPPHSRAAFWFDAHADCNTPETTTSGSFDGMALSMAMGWCWRQMTAQIPGFQPLADHKALLLGVRDIDPLEAELIKNSKLQVVPIATLQSRQLASALEPFTREDCGYIHCDLDALDPSEGRANPFGVAGGLTTEEVQQTIESIGKRVSIKAATLTDYEPKLDTDGRASTAALRIIDAMLAAAHA